jgi:hypothetical protein
MQCNNCHGEKELTDREKKVWVCRICDLWPFVTQELGKTERMNIAKGAGLEIERREKEHRRGR